MKNFDNFLETRLKTPIFKISGILRLIQTVFRKMTEKYKPCIFVGSESGLLKAVDLGKRTATNFYGPNELEKNQANDAITILPDRKILVAMRNGQAKYFDCQTQNFKNPVKMFENDDFEGWAGIDATEHGIFGTDKNGIIRAWSADAFSKQSENVS